MYAFTGLCRLEPKSSQRAHDQLMEDPVLATYFSPYHFAPVLSSSTFCEELPFYEHLEGVLKQQNKTF